jgi:sortase (surface protein transpeptidase)
MTRRLTAAGLAVVLVGALAIVGVRLVASTPADALPSQLRTERDVAASAMGSDSPFISDASPEPRPRSEQPPGPDGSAPVRHRSARIEDLEVERKPRPTRLRIPALGVDAPVRAFGVAPSGEMDVPADASTVAWYEHGPGPGQPGSAVLAAHVDHDGQRGVFFDLADLTAGAELVVELASGRTRTFVVRERASIAKVALPIDELFRREGDAVLTLITCGGEFDPGARSYRSNVVVRAAPAGG